MNSTSCSTHSASARYIRDTGSFRNAEDQFLRWIRGPLSSGIKNTGGIRDLGADRSEMPAALILVSNDAGVSQHDDPWEDTLAVNAGYVSYWGDAKASQPYDDSVQNRKIKHAFDMAASGRREEVPPILMFRKPESGAVEFCGLCVPDHFEVRSYQDDSGTQIPNYLFGSRYSTQRAFPSLGYTVELRRTTTAMPPTSGHAGFERVKSHSGRQESHSIVVAKSAATRRLKPS